MTASPTRPDPNTVDHVHVAGAARQKVQDLTDQLLMRDAKIQEVYGYASGLETQIATLKEQLAAKDRELEADAARRFGPPRRQDAPAPEAGAPVAGPQG